MSKKSEKKNRHQKSLENDTVNEQMTHISQDEIFDYLRKIMSRYSGYNFISVSKSFKRGNDNCVNITMHRNIPIQDKDGTYHSDKDQFVRVIYIANDDFEGMIMDRQKQYTFGNPFKQYVEKVPENNAPDLGKDKVSFKPEDESVQPL